MTSSRIAVVLAAALAACAGSRADQRADRSSTAAQAARPAPPRSAGMGDVCPMDVPDTKVRASDTAEGAALTFTTGSGQVDELRRRVHAMADMHNGHMGASAAQAGTGTQADTGQARPEQGMEGHHGGHGMMPASHASVEDVDGGVRVNIVPDDPSQAEQVRSMARMHADHMQRDGCGMMRRG